MAGHHACPRELGVVLLPFLLVAFVAFKPVYWTCYVRKRKRVVLGLQNNEAVLAMSTRKCVCHGRCCRRLTRARTLSPYDMIDDVLSKTVSVTMQQNAEEF